ncbi:MAG: cob(I)yrinic acid a,c-diamide adenosyltransferase [Kiritimatiellia bacterium]|jgi:cob(I)alamin adenosyltransferase|nr:cob(I)yrinic acid a,c-diamide adenosyltransferase [Kiritimatiellia bacterium]
MATYTGSGDDLETGLLSGERVRKDDPRISALGALDELSSSIGLVAALLPETCSDIPPELLRTQSKLFRIGMWIATTVDSPARKKLVSEGIPGTAEIEAWIDRIDTRLPSLRELILPAGDKSAAAAHMARAICRRTERNLVILMSDPICGGDEAFGEIQVYLNRLSDYLFSVARYCNKQAGIEEEVWAGLTE